MENIEVLMALLDDDDIESAMGTVLQTVVEIMDSSCKFVPPKKKRPRLKNYFTLTISQFNDSLFKEHFRMSPTTMEDLERIIARTLPKNSKLRIQLRKNVMFTIWMLAKQESFLNVGDRFGLAKSSGYRVFRAIIDALVRLIPVHIKWPDRKRLNAVALIFQRRSRGFPGAVGAISACHIHIKEPSVNPNDFCNINKHHSIILQGTCDHKERFMDIFIGMPGRMHNLRVFTKSDLCRKLVDERNPLLPPHLHILGDLAYPIMPNLMTPFREDGELKLRETNYNEKLSIIRSNIEKAFRRLKHNFSRLKYLDVSSPSLGNQIIGACCVLHNFLIDKHEIDYEEQFIDDLNSNNIDEYQADADLIDVEKFGITKRNEIAEILYHS